MPPKSKITKKNIVDTALDTVRKDGVAALNARSLAKALDCSTQPIFSNYSSMKELTDDIIKSANALYESYIREAFTDEEYPPYKATGMAYIRFAREEKELFKLLFMRDRTGEPLVEDRESVRPMLELIMQNLGLTEDEAYLFHLELWLYVHGIATMSATSYLDWDADFVSKALTDAYEGLKYRYTKGK